jgi:hypothetical protein
LGLGKEEARRKKEEGRGKKEEGRRKREEGRGKLTPTPLSSSIGFPVYSFLLSLPAVFPPL